MKMNKLFFLKSLLCVCLILINRSKGYDVQICSGCKNWLFNKVQCFKSSEEVDCSICGCKLSGVQCSGMCCIGGECDFKKGIMRWTCPKNQNCFNVNCARGCRL
nr:uncharacterized protein LOC105844011 [Hydra vulgaris]